MNIHAEGPAFFCWIPKLFGKRVICTIHGLDWDREKWRGSVAWHCTIKAVNTDLDHIHILFEAPPQVQLSKLANNYKTVTSRLIRKNFSEQLKPYYWKPYFWSDSYFVCSVSDRTESAVKSYIDSQ